MTDEQASRSDPPRVSMPVPPAHGLGQPHAAVGQREQVADAPLEEPGFLHPSSIVFEVLSKIRQYIVPAIIGVAGAAQGSVWGAGFAAVFFAGSILATLIRYFTLRYGIQGNDFIVTEGLLYRRVRSVPIRRIQNMDLVQNPLHRIFGVAEVRIETASGTEPEATLRVLTRDQIEQLRSAIFGKPLETRPEGPTTAVSNSDWPATRPVDGRTPDLSLATSPPAAARPNAVTAELLYSIPTRQLVMAGLASNRGLVLLGVALGFISQGDFDQWFGSELANGVEDLLPDQRDPLSLALLIGLGMLVVLVVLRILGTAWYILRFHGYQLTRHGEDLRIACGLFTRVSATIPRKRVHFISVHRSLIMRWMGLAAIRIETAGGAGNDNENAAATVSRRWFLPVVSESEVNRILAELRPGLDWQTSQREVVWHGVSPRTGRRLARQAILASLALVFLGLPFMRPWGWLPGVAIFPVLWIVGQKKSRARRFAAADWGIAYQSGLLTKKLSFTFYDRIQALEMTQTPFDRRWSMATLHVDTAAAGPAEHSIEVQYLDERFAITQFEQLQMLAAQHRPSWA